MERCDIYSEILEGTLQRILDILHRFLWGTGSMVTPPGVYLYNSLFFEGEEKEGLVTGF